ncbi:hypothetical protein, partial [Escherichia coli]|uniref:hypothetical protein n=1 Tax=Escherichia coli TaxID=562 RepID=UPI001BFD8654
ELPASSGLWSSDPSTQQKFDLFNKARILLRFKICLSYVPHTHLNYKGNCHEKYHVVLALARGRLCV